MKNLIEFIVRALLKLVFKIKTEVKIWDMD